MAFRDPMGRKHPMTSVQAAALMLSEGRTEDKELAELMDEGKLLDPDLLIRSGIQRAVGFDFTLLREDENDRYVIRDDEMPGISVTCQLEADFNNQAARLAKAVVKLKKMHERAVKLANAQEAETNE